MKAIIFNQHKEGINFKLLHCMLLKKISPKPAALINQIKKQRLDYSAYTSTIESFAANVKRIIKSQVVCPISIRKRSLIDLKKFILRFFNN